MPHPTPCGDLWVLTSRRRTPPLRRKLCFGVQFNCSFLLMVQFYLLENMLHDYDHEHDDRDAHYAPSPVSIRPLQIRKILLKKVSIKPKGIDKTQNPTVFSNTFYAPPPPSLHNTGCHLIISGPSIKLRGILLNVKHQRHLSLSQPRACGVVRYIQQTSVTYNLTQCENCTVELPHVLSSWSNLYCKGRSDCVSIQARG